MSSKNSSSITWEIQNFSTISTSYQCSRGIIIKNGRNFFSFNLLLEPTYKPSLYMNESIVIHLRHPFNGDDVKVLCSISIIDRNGDRSNTKVSSMYFASGSIPALEGGLYFVSRDYLFDPNNGLLLNDKLTIYCEVEVLGDKNAKNISISTNITKQLSVPQKKALKNYSSLLESGKFSDVVFVVGEKQFKLHKAILATHSPVFSAMFDSDLEESKQNRVEITDLDVDVFEALVAFIYSGNVDRIDQFALELFVAADKYQLDQLKDMCAQWLGSNLTIETVANILLHADMHTSEDLKSKCIDYVSRNTSEVVASDGWKMIAKSIKSYDLLHELYLDLAVKSKIAK